MDNTTLITQVVVAVAGVLMPVVVGKMVFEIKKHVKTLDSLHAIEEFAKAAVVVAEKVGAEDRLVCSTKKSYAVVALQNMLVKYGFEPIDEAILTAEVEKAYSMLKYDIEKIYAEK